MWSNNTAWFDEAVWRYQRGEFDCVEVYSNSTVSHDYDALRKLQAIPVLAIHIGHLDAAGFHQFFLSDDQRNAWNMTVALADFFDAPRIVVHPAMEHNKHTFLENLEKLNDPRIIVENMPVFSPLGGGERVFGTKIGDFVDIAEKRGVCLDIEKLIKAAVFYEEDYLALLSEALKTLSPDYFHISGCSTSNAVDEHGHLWDATYNVGAIRAQLESYTKQKNCPLIFETPKSDGGLETDIKNMQFFKQ